MSLIDAGRPKTRRPHGVLGVGWACIESAVSGRTEHRPTSADYGPDQVRRISFDAGGGLGWRLSALITPRQRAAPWKIVVITGAPSWAEYWAPVMAALPQDREMVVVDRPGYGASEPADCVPDIRTQARALAPLLDGPRSQRVLLVGQSYGAAIATLMAAASPRRVASLALLSSYLGESGPKASWLVEAGARPVGSEALEWHRIVSGIPRYGVDIRERDLPQETEQARALNFNKGCYVGQEIVERIRSRGAVHRKFAGFLAAGTAEITPGSKILVAEKEVGEITSAASLRLAGSAKTVALGYIRREVGVPGREVTIGTARATVVPLPVEEARLSGEPIPLERQRP